MTPDETFVVADFGGPCPHAEALAQLRAEWEQTVAALAEAQRERDNARDLRNVLTGHLADANDRAQRAETEARAGAKLYAAATARAERAEAAIQRVRDLTDPAKHPGYVDRAFILAALDLTEAESDVEELRSQRDFAMRELRAKTEAYDALGTEANRRLLRMATAEATVQRVRALAERYKAEWQDNNGGQFFSACYDDLLAALDSTDPVEDDCADDARTPGGFRAETSTERPLERSDEGPKNFIGDYNDPPCGICGCMNHSCAADCDCCPEHLSDAGLPADGEERK